LARQTQLHRHRGLGLWRVLRPAQVFRSRGKPKKNLIQLGAKQVPFFMHGARQSHAALHARRAQYCLPGFAETFPPALVTPKVKMPGYQDLVSRFPSEDLGPKPCPEKQKQKQKQKVPCLSRVGRVLQGGDSARPRNSPFREASNISAPDGTIPRSPSLSWVAEAETLADFELSPGAPLALFPLSLQQLSRSTTRRPKFVV
ncbi:hypothetical protein CI238_03090, partial [Colletotrichum incanum]